MLSLIINNNFDTVKYEIQKNFDKKVINELSTMIIQDNNKTMIIEVSTNYNEVYTEIITQITASNIQSVDQLKTFFENISNQENSDDSIFNKLLISNKFTYEIIASLETEASDINIDSAYYSSEFNLSESRDYSLTQRGQLDFISNEDVLFENNTVNNIDSSTNIIEKTIITKDETPPNINALGISDIIDINGDYSLVMMYGLAAEAGNTITLYNKLGNIAGTAIVQNDLSWSIDISNLPETPINYNEFFKVSETDAFGNTSMEINGTHYFHGTYSSALTEDTDDYAMLGAGNDRITDNNDNLNDYVVIDGGNGQDKLILGLNFSDYIITTNVNGHILLQETSLSDSDGDGIGDIIEARNIELFKFADATYPVNVLPLTISSFIGTSGDDILVGSHESDTLLGNDGNDKLHGHQGVDRLIGGLGDDMINGGGNLDTAVFSGNMSDYTVLKIADDSYQIRDNRVGSPDGIDLIYNVEYWEFQDRTATTSEIQNELINNETIDIANSLINLNNSVQDTVKLNYSNLIDEVDGNNEIIILGELNDEIILEGGIKSPSNINGLWEDKGTSQDNGVTYNVYENTLGDSIIKLLIEEDIDINNI